MDGEKVLKRDLFGEVVLRSDAGGTVVVRRSANARWWLRWLARLLLRREAEALAAMEGINGVPQLVRHERDTLVRSFIDGATLHRSKTTDPRWFASAARLLRRLHTAGVCHNDLAKEPNLLVRTDGSAGIIDFQLATHSRKRGILFRIAAYEDIRHLLKHKRSYRADLLTERERGILANRSPISSIYMGTVKPIYLFITRRILGWQDREGAGDRGAQE